MPWSDDLKNILLKYDHIFITGGEPTLYSQLQKVLKLDRQISINTNFDCSPDFIEPIIKTRPDITFLVTYQSEYSRRPKTHWFDVNLLEFRKYISSFHYVYFIRDFKVIPSDMYDLSILGKPVEPVFYFENKDLEFVKSMSQQDRNSLKSMLINTFGSDFFEQKNPPVFDVDFIGPKTLDIYHCVQNEEKPYCQNCFPFGADWNLCQRCLDFSKDTIFTATTKQKYIYGAQELVRLLKEI